MTTEQLLIFTDGSVNTKLNIGYGAFLAVNESEIIAGNAKKYLKIKRFEETSSTKLELECLLWALTEISDFEGKIILYTDSQNIIGLPGRRERLEKNDFYSKQNRRITNWELYRDFYRLTDELNIEIKKVSGHKRTSSKDNIDRLFTIVDRASRNALREEKSTN
ncbi:MAG TPA: RNase H family protein [Draconibacterium sp.]|nr:RNase H family protein [Draconibacterium sp.]